MDRRIRKVHILKHPNGNSPFWYLRWWDLTPDGSRWKERWKSTRTTIKKDAESQRRELERELDAGRRSESEMTWEDFVDDFLKKHTARKPKSTLALYRHSLNAFTRVAKPRKLANVSRALLEDFADRRLKDKKAVATVNRDLRHLRAALRWAERRNYISAMPDFKDVFIREDRRQPVIIPEDDFVAMVQALHDPGLVLKKRPAEWWRVFFYVAYYLGLRVGEILGLTWERVSLETLEVRIMASTSKGRKERVVPMAAELAKVFKDWRDRHTNYSPRDEVLPWPYDNYRSLYVDWHAIQTAAGIPDGAHYVPKNCRSTCASELIASNVPTVVVKDFLGHATVATTENYYINTKPALRAAGNARKVRILEPAPGEPRDADPTGSETNTVPEM